MDFGEETAPVTVVAVETVVEEVPATESAPQATQAIDLDELVGEQASITALEPPAMEELSADAFIDAYTPVAAVEAAPAPVEADPRVAWRKKNADALKAKDAEEAKAKKAFAEKAAAHLKKVVEVRQKTLSARKNTNRSNQKLSPDSGVPAEGTAWEKVNGLVNFGSGTHTKDVTRFKSTLISLKTVKA